MSGEPATTRTPTRLAGVAGGLMVLCCLAGPVVLGAAAGTAIGNAFGLLAAIAVAGAVVLVLRLRRGGRQRC